MQVEFAHWPSRGVMEGTASASYDGHPHSFGIEVGRRPLVSSSLELTAETWVATGEFTPENYQQAAVLHGVYRTR